ncbi:MAG: hypothetical protein D6770_01330, partial [Anaerolineae bacterium]
MLQTPRFRHVLSQALQAIVLLYQGVIGIAFIAVVFFAANWLRTPFIGAFVEQTMLFNGVGPGREDDAWVLYNKGLTLRHQLLELDGQPVRSAADMQAILRERFPGENLSVTYRDLDGETHSEQVTLHIFPPQDRVSYLYIPYLVGLAYLVISVWIFGMRRTESAGRAFALFASSMAFGAGGLFDVYTTHRLTPLWTLAVAVAGGGLFDLALSFPQEARWVTNRPYLRWIGYVIAIILAGNAAPRLYDLAHPTAYIAAWRNIYNFTSACFIFLVGMLVFRRVRSPSPIVRQQARVILWSIILAFGPIVGWMLLTAVLPGNFPPILLLLTIFFPLVTGYTILRQRLLQTDYLVRQGMIYAALSLLTIGGYALLVSGLSLIFGSAIQASNPLLIGTMVFFLALALNPLRNRVQQTIDALFFRGQRAYAEHLQTFTRELTAAPDLTAITQALRQRVGSTLAPERIHIYLYDPLSEQYVATLEEDGHPSSDIRFGAQSALAQHLHRERHPLYLGGMEPPPDLEAERTRLTLLGAHLFVPMPAKERPLGWIALGPRLSGQPYTHQDLLFLENLCDQAAVAIERVQTLADMERRVQEMNVLMRIAQGVNITLAFDDILELIYAQTSQIIPTTDFHITLYNKDAGYFYYAFYLENNERLRTREDTPLPSLTGLS